MPADLNGVMAGDQLSNPLVDFETGPVYISRRLGINSQTPW